jgi:hypothetical protein
MSQRRGWENVCCVENGNLANLTDFRISRVRCRILQLSQLNHYVSRFNLIDYYLPTSLDHIKSLAWPGRYRRSLCERIFCLPLSVARGSYACLILLPPFMFTLSKRDGDDGFTRHYGLYTKIMRGVDMEYRLLLPDYRDDRARGRVGRELDFCGEECLSPQLP